MADPTVGYHLPSQPYNTAPLTHPGRRCSCASLVRATTFTRSTTTAITPGSSPKTDTFVESAPGVSGPIWRCRTIRSPWLPAKPLMPSGRGRAPASAGRLRPCPRSSRCQSRAPIPGPRIAAQSTLASGSGQDTTLTVAAGTGHSFLPAPRTRRAIIWGPPTPIPIWIPTARSP